MLRLWLHLPAFGLGLLSGFVAAELPLPLRHVDPASEKRAATDPAHEAPGQMPGPAGSYPARVTSVIDGDTVEVRVNVWIGQEIVTKVRLRGIDAPEMRGACGSERDRALAARRRLEGLVVGQAVVLSELGPDKYFGRVLARIRTPAGEDAGAKLLAEGLARPYRGGRRGSWCEAGLR